MSVIRVVQCPDGIDQRALRIALKLGNVEMPNGYVLAADALVVIHLAYVLTVVGVLLLSVVGGLAGWHWVRNRWLRGVHLAMIGIVVVEAWCHIQCPLTTWEYQLRQAAGQTAAEGTFVGRLAHDWLFIEAPTWVFPYAYSGFALLVLAALYIAPVNWRGKPAA